MNSEIKELQQAMEENIDAIKAKFQADVRQRKARQRLITAREQLHYKTQDLLEQAELQRE